MFIVCFGEVSLGTLYIHVPTCNLNEHVQASWINDGATLNMENLIFGKLDYG